MSNKLSCPTPLVIPERIILDQRIEWSAKAYYGVLCALSRKYGYCWATNKQLSELMHAAPSTITRWNEALKECGHIKKETKRMAVKIENGQVIYENQRNIYTKQEPNQKAQNELLEDTPLLYCLKSSNKNKKEEKEERGERARGASTTKATSSLISFGSDGLVKLTAEQHSKLVALHGKELIDRVIEEVNCFVPNRKLGTYKNFYSAIKQWILRDAKQTTEASKGGGYSRRSSKLHFAHEDTPDTWKREWTEV